VRAMGRAARGVRAMSLAEGDFILAAEVVADKDLILSIAENGFGKRTEVEKYRLTARGGKGVINMKTTPKTGKVVAALEVKADTDVLLITKDGKIIRLESGEIRRSGRSAQGVRLVRVENGDKVAAASVITADELNGKNGAEEQGNLTLQ